MKTYKVAAMARHSWEHYETKELAENMSHLLKILDDRFNDAVELDITELSDDN